MKVCISVTCLVKNINAGEKAAITCCDMEDWIICNFKSGCELGIIRNLKKGGSKEVAIVFDMGYTGQNKVKNIGFVITDGIAYSKSQA